MIPQALRPAKSHEIEHEDKDRLRVLIVKTLKIHRR